MRNHINYKHLPKFSTDVLFKGSQLNKLVEATLMYYAFVDEINQSNVIPTLTLPRSCSVPSIVRNALCYTYPQQYKFNADRSDMFPKFKHDTQTLWLCKA